jgi:type II secretory pathway component PulM
MTISQMRNWLISVIKRIRATGPLTSAASVTSWQQSGLVRQVSITILLVAILLISVVLARPIQERLENTLAMRPAQWGHLQQLVATVRTQIAQPRLVPPLDEAELSRIRTTLTNQGIKPAVLRLTSDNPPRLEMQLNTVLFASVVDTLEDLRRTWQLFPVRANVQASGNVGVVNASFTLEQSK